MWTETFPMISLGVVFAGMGGLCILRLLPRNRWAGIRTRNIMANDETWSAGHDAASLWLLAGGAAAFGSLVVRDLAAGYQWTPMIVVGMKALIVVFLFVGARLGERAAKRVLRAQETRSGSNGAGREERRVDR